MCAHAHVCACINFLMPDISDATADQGISVSSRRTLLPVRIHSLWTRRKCGPIEPDATRLVAVHSLPCLPHHVQWLREANFDRTTSSHGKRRDCGLTGQTANFLHQSNVFWWKISRAFFPISSHLVSTPTGILAQGLMM